MIKPVSTLLVAALLTACGGGGGDASPAPAPAAAAPVPGPAAPVPAPAPVATAPAVFENPPAATGINLSVGSFNTGTSGGNYQTSFNSATNLTVGGDLNKFWMTAAQPGGTVTVSGHQNTIVFRPSSTPATVTVTGSANTFYLPEGSAIKLEGSGAAMSTIKYYKP